MIMKFTLKHTEQELKESNPFTRDVSVSFDSTESNLGEILEHFKGFLLATSFTPGLLDRLQIIEPYNTNDTEQDEFDD